MNILVIGNGFDLAHGLPTRYTDFLDFIDSFKIYYNNYRHNTCKMDINPFSDILLKIDAYYFEISETINNLITDNHWLTFFNYEKSNKVNYTNYNGEENHTDNKKDNGNNNWIDFESEISKVIQTLDGINNRFNNKVYLSEKENITEISEYELKYLGKIFPNLKSELNPKDVSSTRISKEQILKIRDTLLLDLNRLTKCLEIYLILVSKTFLEGNDRVKKLPLIESLDIDHVISFNYTDTFRLLYAPNNDNIKYDFIHGKLSDLNDDSDSKLVLGIDEFISDDRKNTDLTFVDFKKYYQRVFKDSTCNYKTWLKYYKPSKDRKINPNDAANGLFYPIPNGLNIYIFGHSIDVTDKDVLEKLLLDENSGKRIIYYFKEKSRPDKIKNLIQIIGKDNFIEYTSGSDAKIKFIDQEK